MKKIFFLAAIIVAIITINGLIRSIYDLWKKDDLIVNARQELEEEKRKNKELKDKLIYVKSEEFLEKEAREKLFWVRKGEAEVIIPKNLIATPSATPTPEPPNWKKWIELFVGK